VANQTTHLDLISSGQASKEVTSNDLSDAASPSMTCGRRASTTAALTWGYYGGTITKDDGSLLQIANGTVALTDAATNYVELDLTDGTIDVNTSAWTTGKIRLYEITTSGGAVTDYTDWRTADVTGSGGSVVTAAAVTVVDSGAYFTSGDVEGVLQEIGAQLGGFGSGSVTSVALSAPAEFTVSGSPVTTSGTLTFSKANQSANLVYAGPSSGGAAAPTFRSLVQADLPTQPFDVMGFLPGIPTTSQILARIPVARAVNFPANFSGSYGTASAASTGTATFDIQKNGSSIGSMVFTTSASATFTTTGGSAQSLAAGDVLMIVAPATPDATLADVGLCLAGTR
jgi:hypothetical protein